MGQSEHQKSAVRDRSNLSPLMSAVGGRADAKHYGSEGPLLAEGAKSGHSHELSGDRCVATFTDRVLRLRYGLAIEPFVEIIGG